VSKLSGADIELLEELAVNGKDESENFMRNQTLVLQVVFSYLFYDMNKDAVSR
jgi:hypothetical protein